jgi:hypothetical protein
MTQTSLGLSDTEFLEKDPAELLAETDEKPAEQEIESSDKTDEDKVATSEEEVSEAQEQTESETIKEEVSQPEGDTQTEPEPFADSDTTESLDTSKIDSTDTEGDTPETTEFDYESAYKKVSEPFKANGVDMQVKSPEDIIRLMQMGANYQKKMGKLKPNLKIIKMLENNELLDEAKLNNLIDLSKKDPKAIAKLVKESDVDPLEIDKDAPTEYEPTNYSITDKEYNLDRVLDDIKDTETFNKTINVLTKEWDTESRSAISDQPEIIGIVNAHMANGIYDEINAVLQQEKALGKLNGIPDVEAYRQVAEHMNKNNMFKQPESAGKSKVSSKTDEKAEADRDKKRKAAAPVKQTTTKKAPPDDNFLGLSDEDFMKKYAVR